MTGRTDLTAALSALQSAQGELLRDPNGALPSIRRIVSRIQQSALLSGRRELAFIAGAVLEAEEPDEISPLIDHLIAQVRDPRDGPEAPSRVLMVEDDRVTASVLADGLRASGNIVEMAETAAAALEKLAEADFDAILLDLVLPDADGRDVLVNLRARPELRGTVILVVTARTDPGAHAECFALGANGVLTKPIHPDVLSSAVAAHLQHRSDARRERFTDSLTGLPNRAGFFDALEAALPVARRQNQPMAVAMLDIDHFKTVNDTHGHAVGDVVLRRCGQLIAASLRISDLVARYGGEEFCAFLPNTTVEGARTALDKARTAVRAARFDGANGAQFSVTFSAGVSALEPHQTVDVALADADARLYIAKATGRNRIVTELDPEQVAAVRIMLVEDDDAVARMVDTLLTREGFAVTRFDQALAAMKALEEEDFAITILDVTLPDISGFDFLERLRALRDARRLPVVMLTGSADEADVVRGFELGVNDYVTKPFHAAELVARVRRILAGR